MSFEITVPAVTARAMKPALLAGAMVAVAFALPLLGAATAQSTLTSLVTHGGLRGVLAFSFLSAALMAFGLPRQVPAFVAGYAFGIWPGTLIALIATISACGIDLGWARALGRDFVRQRFGKVLGRVDATLTAQPFAATLTLRLLPVGSNLLLNLVAGLTSVKLVPFLAASFIGFIPQTIIFAMIGRGSMPSRAHILLIGISLFCISTVLGFALLRRSKQLVH